VTPRRISTKHGPRLDDELKRETVPLEHGDVQESRSDEWRSPEAADPGEQPPGVVDRSTPRADPALARRELSRHLRLGVFPAERDALVAEAQANEAPDQVLEWLREVPPGRRFETVYEVWDALGGELEPRAQETLAERRDGEAGR
jgi:hypothetical protein